MNALVTHLQRASDPVESVRTFLSAVRWAGPGGGSWVNDFTQVCLIVEIGLADFGNPDLMIVCHGPAGVRCVFVESKIVMYLASMRPNHKGMQLPNFNSSINGQLSFKYRFARSLHAAASDAITQSRLPNHQSSWACTRLNRETVTCSRRRSTRCARFCDRTSREARSLRHREATP